MQTVSRRHEQHRALDAAKKQRVSVVFDGETTDAALSIVLSRPIPCFFEITTTTEQYFAYEIHTAFEHWVAADNSAAWSDIIHSILGWDGYGSGQND